VGCDEVRELLAEHLLGTLDPELDERVRRHLRGCAICRAELAALAEGVTTLAHAAHDVEPPPELRDRVLGVMAQEWAEEPEPTRAVPIGGWLLRAAAVVAIVASLSWGVWGTVRAHRFEQAAAKYETFLGILGGENVRVGALHPAGSQAVEGSVVVYDSKVGQSWVLVLARAPGVTGEANVTLHSKDTTIDLHPLDFAAGGEASTWLVTSSDLHAFDRITVWNDSGPLASASVTSD
jgi:anti-sigma factor RsiW